MSEYAYIHEGNSVIYLYTHIYVCGRSPSDNIAIHPSSI